MSVNQLALKVSKHIYRSHVYDFIAGRKDLTTEKANYLLAAMGLEISRGARSRQ